MVPARHCRPDVEWGRWRERRRDRLSDARAAAPRTATDPPTRLLRMPLSVSCRAPLPDLVGLAAECGRGGGMVWGVCSTTVDTVPFAGSFHESFLHERGRLRAAGSALQRLEGDGKAFMHAGGTVIERRLNNETLKIDTGCVVGYTPGIDFNIEASGSLRSMVFGGEGIFLATLRGTGTVWLQSMPIRKLIQAISPYGKNVRKESQSILGNFLER